MAKQCSILDMENLRAVFNKIMQAHQLKPEDVRKDRAKVNISHKGQFDCVNCTHSWKSNFSWITFDLNEMKITYRWKMKCKYCLTACQPTFSVEQIEVMYENAVRWYKGENTPREVNIGYRSRDRLQPHIPALCEKCRWGIEQCWNHRRGS